MLSSIVAIAAVATRQQKQAALARTRCSLRASFKKEELIATFFKYVIFNVALATAGALLSELLNMFVEVLKCTASALVVGPISDLF